MNWSTLQRGLDLHVSAVASPEPRTDSEARFSGTHRGCWSRGKICGCGPPGKRRKRKVEMKQTVRIRVI